MSTAGNRSLSDDHLAERLAASLRENYLEMMPSSLAYGHLALVVSCIVFWNHTNTEALGLWAGTQSILLFGSTLLTTNASASNFMRWATIAEISSSIGWGALPFVAPAESADWQTMQGVLLIGLLLSTLGNSTASKRLHLASTIPLALTGTLAFTLNGEGAAGWLGAGFGVALAFTLASGIVLRQVQEDLSTSSLRTEGLAADLTAEGARLKVANRELEYANAHLDIQARRDHLTGLINRAGFTDLLNEAVANNPGEVLVCYLDLDRFKRLNDAFGHRFGDQVLAAAARRIRRGMHAGEVVARQGGDELTILSRAQDSEAAHELGERVLAVFADPFLIENRQVELNVSAGLVWLPEPTSADDLMRFADTALYRAKERGRSQFAIFDEAMRIDLERETQLQIDLGTAFDRLEITPYLQPVVDITTGAIVSAEALARWEVNGRVRTAADFIGIARDLGTLDRINTIVSDGVLAFQQAVKGIRPEPCPIAVNVSPLHLEPMLARVLEDHDPGSVIFEITEDNIFSDIAHANELLQQARDAGAEILLDDFGVGFSSLSIATQLPIDGFKIDRGFVASLTGNTSAVAAVEAIVQLARRMDLRVIAEGVETPDQLALLREIGVRYAQGYLFSEAVPFDTFKQWLVDRHSFDIADLSARGAVA